MTNETKLTSAIQRKDLAAICFLACAVLANAVLLNAGVVCSNDGSHYALVRALGDHGSAVIDGYTHYNADVDISRYQDHYYSDRPPGTAFVATPLYAIAKRFSGDDRTRQFAATLTSGFAAALGCVLLYLAARELQQRRKAALFAALAIGLASPLRTYASTLFSHAVAFALVTAVWLLMLRELRTPSVWQRRGAALLAGYGASVDYTSTVPTGLMLLIGLAATVWPTTMNASAATPTMRERTRVVLDYLLAGIAGTLPLLLYNYACFGSPFTIAYDHQLYFPQMHSMSNIYGGSIPNGLFGLFFHPRAGLVFWSPVLLLSLLFLWPLLRKQPWLMRVLLVVPGLAFVLLTSRYYEVGAGASRDARYLTPIYAMFGVPLALAYGEITARNNRVIRHRGFFAVAALLFLSIALQTVKQLAIWVRNGEFWLPIFRDAPPSEMPRHVIAFLQWAFPHPVAAFAVLGIGVLGAEWWARGKSLENPSPMHDAQSMIN